MITSKASTETPNVNKRDAALNGGGHLQCNKGSCNENSREGVGTVFCISEDISVVQNGQCRLSHAGDAFPSGNNTPGSEYFEKRLSYNRKAFQTSRRQDIHSTGIGNHWISGTIVLILIMTSLPGVDVSKISDTVCEYMDYKRGCLVSLDDFKRNLNGSDEIYCEGGFDEYVCWPHSKPGVVKVPCPGFLRNYNESKLAYRYCMENGSWFMDEDLETGRMGFWRSVEECVESSNATVASSVSEAVIHNLRVMYTVGYSISLVCLTIALLLLAFFKKLHCTRNYIHMNLMVSFIIRYVVILVKDSVLRSHYGLDGVIQGDHLDMDQLIQYCDDSSGSTGWVLTRCRLAITLMHYAITANYFWLLAEGLYLQMLLVFVMSENKYFAGFMVFGWGAPWISVIIWVVLRMNFENFGCWDMNQNMHIWWTIRAPIMIVIIINFCIFINIVRLIVSKLKAHNMAKTDKKLRLAKSTLALIPLLGMHYIVFLAMTEELVGPDQPTMHLKLAFEMFFSSIQGTLISVLYCFLNNEVRAEVCRAWNQWRSHKNLPKGNSTIRKWSASMNSNQGTQVTQVYSRNSANGSEVPSNDHSQSRKSSSNSESECKEDSVFLLNGSANWNGRSNVNYVALEGLSEGTKQKDTNLRQNDDATDIIISIPNKNDTNGNTDCLQDEPFLLRVH